MKIGVLALQGAFIEHRKKLTELGADSFEIRNKFDLSESMDGLILPGGESTVMGKLLYDLDMLDDLKSKIKEGLPVFGTCAGLILLAKKIEGSQESFLNVMDITVKRNAYGRQLGSFFAEAQFTGIGNIPMTFIRAPYISELSDSVTVLSEVGGNIVAASEKNILGTSYHPELTSSNQVHKYFLDNFCY
ncbi:pyridoxal 5'-phosphate synthase glutaminase subunit PdxT [Apibacter raozihei]|uniref:pyridoxal 5'-phosphate synthase glutaminase subunit PdxT n=1 Tax=Apibacter raozihei TaxID=2500547 RepID=UPI000FE36549|nr:pyridoxal 5'-phosphate synthase glutaminase subunit PdxT [Apibacter raozihei]